MEILKSKKVLICVIILIFSLIITSECYILDRILDPLSKDASKDEIISKVFKLENPSKLFVAETGFIAEEVANRLLKNKNKNFYSILNEVKGEFYNLAVVPVGPMVLEGKKIVPCLFLTPRNTYIRHYSVKNFSDKSAYADLIRKYISLEPLTQRVVKDEFFKEFNSKYDITSGFRVKDIRLWTLDNFTNLTDILEDSLKNIK